MNKTIKTIITICVLSFLTVLFLVGMQSYFHYKEIDFATDECYEIDGVPKVEKDFLALNYSFSCEKDR
ncbi:hypothetical protein [Bacillus dakarensis]|uniref:hypothetical protein n=1 Tax=Robertmurraya dakarensis TaxID=1926278 RepID=UPI000981F9D1|nr:hypothetical protein [Bacillus dakarensis]